MCLLALFDFTSQQDIAEILKVVFDELKTISIRADDLLFNTLRTIIICNSSFCSAVREEKVVYNLNKNSRFFFMWFNDIRKWVVFCPSCNGSEESIKYNSAFQSTSILVIYLKNFCVEQNKVIKDDQFSKCLPQDPVQIQITESSKAFFFMFLVATINHPVSCLNNQKWP